MIEKTKEVIKEIYGPISMYSPYVHNDYKYYVENEGVMIYKGVVYGAGKKGEDNGEGETDNKVIEDLQKQVDVLESNMNLFHSSQLNTVLNRKSLLMPKNKIASVIEPIIIPNEFNIKNDTLTIFPDYKGEYKVDDKSQEDIAVTVTNDSGFVILPMSVGRPGGPTDYAANKSYYMEFKVDLKSSTKVEFLIVDRYSEAEPFKKVGDAFIKSDYGPSPVILKFPENTQSFFLKLPANNGDVITFKKSILSLRLDDYYMEDKIPRDSAVQFDINKLIQKDIYNLKSGKYFKMEVISNNLWDNDAATLFGNSEAYKTETGYFCPKPDNMLSIALDTIIKPNVPYILTSDYFFRKGDVTIHPLNGLGKKEELNHKWGYVFSTEASHIRITIRQGNRYKDGYGLSNICLKELTMFPGYEKPLKSSIYWELDDSSYDKFKHNCFIKGNKLFERPLGIMEEYPVSGKHISDVESIGSVAVNRYSQIQILPVRVYSGVYNQGSLVLPGSIHKVHKIYKVNKEDDTLINLDSSRCKMNASNTAIYSPELKDEDIVIIEYYEDEYSIAPNVLLKLYEENNLVFDNTTGDGFIIHPEIDNGLILWKTDKIIAGEDRYYVEYS